jgi:hypothetical protein
MTMTMKVNQNEEYIPVFVHDFRPDIPAFLDAKKNAHAFLFRTKNQRFFEERWVNVTSYIDETNVASDIDLESYGMYHDIDLIESMPDLPEPIAIHDRDIWLECTENEYSDFVHDFQDLQYPDERMYG